ncbi:related to Sporulation-specific protein SPO7 [Saccharomycodes ludwigii]|uniref:Related to Sporulation-specific protein SPO7 n=1 Tax=Saccharomycodes ludwigii TaxID=36035 RepID=A0A376B7M1_9ASCO|nr:hypothetical protein SCDLUD_000502 [Saccharomycodes ludwigii]KAH3902907.1 hypothetical protein SCDLUD_000502 [Saccharomycodes ludwigii]SSD60687.1 related to Sporulation-specific protein SPO7 [Saccharomycodes ludwigii]
MENITINIEASDKTILKKTSRSSSISSNSTMNTTSTKILKSDISPSSMIFRNLLILEDDLRRQYKQQVILKYEFTCFLSTLTGFAGFAFYHLYIIGNYTNFYYQFILCFILITIALFHLSGEYRRTIVIPRKFFSFTNKGLRQFNTKLVKNYYTLQHFIYNTILVEKLIDILLSLNISIINKLMAIANDSYTLNSDTDNNSGIVTGATDSKGNNNVLKRVAIKISKHVDFTLQKRKIWFQTNLQNDVKLILNPRAFSNEIREGWELYRDEFWARERQRRYKRLCERMEKL